MRTILVLYKTEYCPACKAMKQYLDELGIRYFELDASNFEDIHVVPILRLYRDGKLVDQFEGFARRQLHRWLRSYGLLL